MADEIANSAPAPAASAAAPNAEAAIPPAPAVTETTAPTDAAPAVESAPAPENTDAAAEKPSEPAKADTLLAGEKKAEEKPADPDPEAKPEEKPADPAEGEPAPLPNFEPFTLPEDVKFDSEKMGEFTKTLAEFEALTKAPHEEMQKLGQQMVERHVAELKESMERYTESLTQAWEKQKNDWKESFLKDPEFVNRTDTVVNSAIDAISVYGGDTKQQQEFRDLMESSGVGNHPAMIRMLSNVMLAKAEPKPLAAPQIGGAEKTSKIQKMYGKKTG
jgi:hypothetical protein